MSINYYSNDRSEMLRFVPLSAKKIIEVGCGKGLFGKQIIARQGAEVWGVEMDKDSAEQATMNLSKVILGTFTNEIALPRNYFDCIIFNDVLEHMQFPEDALAISKNLMIDSYDSSLVCSIPNFRYIRNMFEILVKKDFHYKSDGILDKTHLRFFTQKSILRFFNENKYNIVQLEGINPSSSSLLKILNFFSLNFFNDCEYLQFAVVAQPIK